MKNNRLLANYLFLNDFKWAKPLYFITQIFATWRPNADWSQLMAVVEKIKDSGAHWRLEDTELGKYDFMIWDNPEDDPVVYSTRQSMIDAVYYGCVGYVKLKTNNP